MAQHAKHQYVRPGNLWAKELDSLKKLAPNWDSYGAEPPNPTAIRRLESLLELLPSVELTPTKIVPSVEGGAAVCFINGAKYADVECFNNGTLLAVLSTGRGTPEAWELGASKAAIWNTLERIRDFLRD
jgi:hypothetical protein